MDNNTPRGGAVVIPTKHPRCSNSSPGDKVMGTLSHTITIAQVPRLRSQLGESLKTVEGGASGTWSATFDPRYPSKALLLLQWTKS
ncbi:jg22482 [Pararge aegeria aegeria]|uniref:Jg22482 protein n=1 Tax=Pararge aegeria aegeria TaxID=348720 RepID=A0A8S4SAG4_9NEOP|nr:jg22482 [Pararge aegeria aegeria]